MPIGAEKPLSALQLNLYEVSMAKNTRKSPRNNGATRNNGHIPVTVKTHHDKNGGHPHVIMGDIDNKHVSVGLSTHHAKGKGSKNYRMEKSPFNDGKQSYMRRQGTVAPKSEYSGLRKGTLTPKDYERAKLYGDRAKEKYINGKKDKKK